MRDEIKVTGLLGEDIITHWGGKNNDMLHIIAKDGDCIEACSTLIIEKSEAEKLAKWILKI